MTGTFKANQKLNENELADNLGISRPPIREAFRILENEHLVVNVPRKGTYVADISIEDLEGLYQVRVMIESYVIDLLETKKIRALPEVLPGIEECARLPIPSLERPDEMIYYHEIFTDFHKKMVEATENYRINHYYKGITLSLTRYQIIYLFFIRGSVDKSLQDHREILSFIEKGEYQEAKKCLINHIKYTETVLYGKILESMKGK